MKLGGLLNWASVAALLRAANVQVHAGTVPVERLWANYVDFFPDAATSMGVEWWSLLNQLGYMRYNYRHFNHAELPGFTHGDALLAQRIDSLVTLTRALQQDSAGQSSPVLDALRFALAELSFSCNLDQEHGAGRSITC